MFCLSEILSYYVNQSENGSMASALDICFAMRHFQDAGADDACRLQEHKGGTLRNQLCCFAQLGCRDCPYSFGNVVD